MISQGHDRDFEVFYDGACPLCRREIAWLRRLDRDQKLYFTDISLPNFDSSRFGKTYEELMAQIHGRLPNGDVIFGVEVLRQLYSTVGFHKTVAISRWPVIKQAIALGYSVFARLRTKLPVRRCTDQTCTLPSTGDKQNRH